MSRERITFEAYLENMMSGGFDEIEHDGRRAFSRIDHEVDETNRGVGRLDDSVSNLTRNLVGMAGGYLAVDRLADWGGEIVDVTSKYQRFDAVLTNTLGSTSRAREYFNMLENFGANTPFQVDELTDSFVKLANQGFEPTMRQMTSLGDIAASKGKSFDQLTEALIDAEVGEFERLKEFGIRASKQGDKVTFTFKGQKQVVDFTQDSIRKYILSLGKAAGVSGAMAKIAATTGGKISNFKDNVDKLNSSLGQRFKPIIDKTIESSSRWVSILNDIVEVPVSEKMEEERREANLLVRRLGDVNVSEEERLRILNRLKEINPEITKGINAQKIEMSQLVEQLREYNVQTYRDILMQQKKEEIQKAEDKRDTLLRKTGGEHYQKQIQKVVDNVLKEDPNRGEFLENIFLNYLPEEYLKTLSPEQMKTIDFYGFNDKSIANETRQRNMMIFFADIAKQQGMYNMAASLGDIMNIKKFQAYNSLVNKQNDVIIGLEEDVRRYGEKMGLNKKKPDEGIEGEDSGEGDTGGSSKADTALAGISGDNRQVKNITINVDKLGGMEGITFTDEGQADTLQEFAHKLRQTLMTVLNDTNIIAN